MREPDVNLKYLIISQDGIEVPLVFSPLVQHEKVADQYKIISAGFCKLDETGKWTTGGRSASLGMAARPQDAGILNAHLCSGGSVHHTNRPVAAQAALQRNFTSPSSRMQKNGIHFLLNPEPSTRKTAMKLNKIRNLLLLGVISTLAAPLVAVGQTTVFSRTEA